MPTRPAATSGARGCRLRRGRRVRRADGARVELEGEDVDLAELHLGLGDGRREVSPAARIRLTSWRRLRCFPNLDEGLGRLKERVERVGRGQLQRYVEREVGQEPVVGEARRVVVVALLSERGLHERLLDDRDDVGPVLDGSRRVRRVCWDGFCVIGLHEPRPRGLREAVHVGADREAIEAEVSRVMVGARPAEASTVSSWTRPTWPPMPTIEPSLRNRRS